jgi:heptosyltransferase I
LFIGQQNPYSPQKADLPEKPALLIILMGSLGDVTRGLCLVAPIKQALPDSTITWLVEPRWADLVSAHPLIDEVIVFDRPNWWRGGLAQLLRQLRSGRFDCVLDLQRHFKSGLFSFFTRAPRRIGFHPKNAKEGNRLFNTAHIPFQPDDYPKINHYLAFLAVLEIPLPEVLDFGFENETLQKVAGPLLSETNRPFIAIVLGSSWRTKEWGYEGYWALIKDLLQTTSFDIVLVDDPSKGPLADRLTQTATSNRVTNLVGKTSVLELAAVLNEAALAVGPDCGAGHIAAAVKTPYVSLFGPTDPKRTAPYGNNALVVNKNIPCAPCYKDHCARKDILCMRAIDVTDVKEKILEGLSQKTPSTPFSRTTS